LNVGQQILVRGEAVEQLRVRIGLNLRQTKPTSMLDKGLDAPGGQTQHQREDQKDAQPCHHFSNQSNDLSFWGPRPLRLLGPDEKRRIVQHLGVLRQKGGQPRVRGQITLVGEERVIEAEHLLERRRILCEQSLKFSPRLPCGLVARR
jgi:hypothetical protein